LEGVVVEVKLKGVCAPTVAVLVAVHPAPSVTTTVYVPGQTGLMEAAVPPFDQRKYGPPIPPLGMQTAWPSQEPGHVSANPAIARLIVGETVIVTVLLPVQPFASVAVTEYVVVLVGVAVGLETVVLLNVPPGVHA
jgi:hypothetical protein